MARPSSARTTTTATSRRSAARKHSHDVPAYQPGPINRKENKPLDSGARFEHETKVRLQRQGIDVWRNPGIRLKRLSDKGLVTDYGAYLDVLSTIVEERVPEISGRPRYNVIGSLKSQTTEGSAEHKISTEIIDMAWAADSSRTVPFVVIDSKVFSVGQIAQWKELGKMEMVVVLMADELTGTRLQDELVAMAKRRRRMYGRMRNNGYLPPRKAPYRYFATERRYLDRRKQFRAATKANELFA